VLVVKPAAVTGVPDTFDNLILPPALCVNTIAPELLILALT
jgi:hypothetical protein